MKKVVFFYNNWNRDYDQHAGRYLQKDPLRFSGGSWNLYAYVNSSPINHYDEDGLTLRKKCPCKDPCKEALEWGLVNKSSGGRVVCCNGRKYACAFWPGDQPPKPQIRQCIIDHEKGHFHNVECPTSGISLGRAPRDAATPSEVIEWQQTKDCLKNHQSNYKQGTREWQELQGWINHSDAMINHYSGKRPE